MKGLELPINALIIIVLAVIVLISIILLFTTGIKLPQNVITAQTALSNACLLLYNNFNCAKSTNSIVLNDFDADQDGSVGTLETGSGWTWGDSCNPSPPADGDNLASLCACYFQVSGSGAEANCKKLCECP